MKQRIKKLTKFIKRHSGRNSSGKIVIRHRQGGAKKIYRIIDFKRNDRLNIEGKIERMEYDPYRSADIALVLYKDGQRRYVLAQEGLKEGDRIIMSEKTDLKIGNRMHLKNIPSGTIVSDIELHRGEGGILARSAGSSVQVLGQEERYTYLKLPSSKVRKVSCLCFATIGKISNSKHNLEKSKKAGDARHKGRKPVVRASVMNPVDHPYGGGEGRSPRGIKRPKNIYGKVMGKKTRKKKKWSDKFIVKKV